MAEKRAPDRIDLNPTPASLVVTEYAKVGDGWHLLKTRFEPAGSLAAELQRYESEGYELAETSEGWRAVRRPANPDRVDFLITPSAVVVNKYWRLAGRDHLRENQIHPAAFDVEWALSWLEDHGYQVFRWPGGARAFKGAPWPIRTTAQIQRKRRELEREVSAGRVRSPEFNLLGLDLAYCL